jgi:hypothetical protein
MLGQVKDGEWNVLVLDAVTTKVISSAVHVSDILDYGIARKTGLQRRGWVPPCVC